MQIFYSMISLYFNILVIIIKEHKKRSYGTRDTYKSNYYNYTVQLTLYMCDYNRNLQN